MLALSLLAATSLSSVRADSAAYAKKVLADPDVVGFWTFDGNFADQTANKNDAKPGGADAAAITFVEMWRPPVDADNEVSVIGRETESGVELCYRIDLDGGDAMPCQ